MAAFPLTYKCELYGSKLVVVDRWFPSSKTCSNCGTKKEILSLSERVFDCGNCGFVVDRDLNADFNFVKNRQLGGVSLWTGESRHARVKQEVNTKVQICTNVGIFG